MRRKRINQCLKKKQHSGLFFVCCFYRAVHSSTDCAFDLLTWSHGLTHLAAHTSVQPRTCFCTMYDKPHISGCTWCKCFSHFKSVLHCMPWARLFCFLFFKEKLKLMLRCWWVNMISHQSASAGELSAWWWRTKYLNYPDVSKTKRKDNFFKSVQIKRIKCHHSFMKFKTIEPEKHNFLMAISSHFIIRH